VSQKRCHYCGAPLVPPAKDRWRVTPDPLEAVRDHRTPLSRGGGLTVLACRLCNGLKGTTPYLAFVFESFPLLARLLGPEFLFVDRPRRVAAVLP